MRREAAAAGFFDSGFGRHPKLQIYSVRELLGHIAIDLPPLGRSEGFKRAPPEKGRKATQTGLDL